METFEYTVIFIGGVALLLILMWLYSATKAKAPPTISEEQAKKLELIKRAMLTGAEIKSSVRIVTEEDIVITFKLERPGFQVNASFTDYLPEKFI